MNHSLLPLIFLLFLLYSTIPSVQTLTISGYGIKDLESNDPITFQKEADWWNLTKSASSAKITQTTSTLKWLLGGPGILGPANKTATRSAFSRTYTNLPPHTFVTISAVFWYFDSLNSLTRLSPLEVSLESGMHAQSPFLSPKADFKTEDGGRVGVNDLSRDHVRYGLRHVGSTLTLKFVNRRTSNPSVQSFGFRELHIHLSNYSDLMFPGTCHISGNVSSLQFDQCPCSIGQAKDSSGNCASCADNCDFCFGTAPEECLACSAGAYWDGTKCNTCDMMCQTCTGTTSNDCPSCKYGFYNYGNNTCMESCEPPFVVEQRGVEFFCNRPCNSSQFYWAKSKTCLNKCDLPLAHASDENGIEYCWNPCPNPHNYLYANGSCYSTCQAPLLPKHDSEAKLCVNPCSETDYLYPNRSCMSTCSSPLLSRSEPGAKYCWSPCALKSDFLYNNGSCETTCPAPLISRSEPGFKYCFTPCSSVNDFIYDNRSCGTSCPSPLVSRTEPMIAQYCSNPCPSSSNYFLYPNGSCSAECSWPLLSRTEPGVRYCYSPCASSSDYIYPNGTCEDKCPYPLMTRSEPGLNYCFTPCKSDQYLYDDQSCYDSCEFPLIQRLEAGDIHYCKTPCHRATDYVYPDGVCRSVCEYPYKVGKNPVYKVCSMNMDEIQTHQTYSLANTVDVANTVCGIGGLLTGFMSPGDPTSMLMWSLLKMFQSPRFMDVNFPTYLTKIFAKQNDNYIGVAGGGGYRSSSFRRRVLAENDDDLGKFSFYNIPHNFLENYWQQLLVFGALEVMLIICVLLLHLLKNQRAIKIIKYLKSSLKWNLPIVFFCGTYGDLVLYSALEFQSASFDDLASTMGFFTCLSLMILAIYVPLKILFVINSIRKARVTQQDVEKNWRHNRVFFETYKSEQTIQEGFLFIYLMRVAFFNVVIGYLFRSPFGQVLLINFTSVGMLIYLLSKAPIKDKLCLAQHVMMEFSLFAYNFCLLILAIMDFVGAQAESTRAFFGGFMVLVMIMAPIGAALLILFKMAMRVHELYLQLKAQKDVLKLIENGLKFQKVQACGSFVIEINHNEINHGLDESNFVIQGFIREISRNYYISSGDIFTNYLDGERSSMNFRLESNVKSSTVEIETKKGQNVKRRKMSVFKNDDYLPD